MDKEIKRRNVKQNPFDCIIDVEYVPFPSEEKRREAYYTHTKLFLRAKERELQERQGELDAEKSQGAGI
jgi:hypothetical protein